MMMLTGLGGLRTISETTSVDAYLARLDVIDPILTRFVRRVSINARYISSSLRTAVGRLNGDFDDIFLAARTPSMIASRRITYIRELNNWSRDYNSLERAVNAAIAAGTGTAPAAPAPVPTAPEPGLEPPPRRYEDAASRAGAAIATGTARGIGQVVLIGSLVALGGVGLWMVLRRRDAIG
jgi:hypothetical protein